MESLYGIFRRGEARVFDLIDRLSLKFGERVDPAALGLFRIVWGLLMMAEGIRKLPKIAGIYSPNYFHFKYSLFPFVEPLPYEWMMSVEMWVMIAAGAAIAAGLALRWSALLFALIYAHLFLIEKLYYNNHFYLTILICFLLSFTAADRCYSLRGRFGRSAAGNGDDEPATAPLWNLVLLRGQIVVLYFFGGVAKLNSDWIHSEPIRFWFGQKTDVAWPLQSLLTQEWFVNFVSISGIAIDLTAGFLLLHRKTFPYAAVVLLGFHLTNDQLFKIGLFPWLAISMLLLFVDPAWVRQSFAWIRSRLGRPVDALRTPVLRGSPVRAATVAWVVAFLAVQVLLPLRILFYADNPSWTEVGHSFSWRMMLRHKDAYVKFLFDPPEAERMLEQTDNLPRISSAHLQKMVKTPHFILQYVHALDATLEEIGMKDVKISALAVVSLNGRSYQLMIDPRRDLTQASYGFFEVPDWIVPLEKNRRVGLYPTTVSERHRAIESVIATAFRDDVDAVPPVAAGPAPR
jgi:uncharacterized membrane protein YphA (DoxX/SURF4 family)